MIHGKILAQRLSRRLSEETRLWFLFLLKIEQSYRKLVEQCTLLIPCKGPLK